MTVESFCGAAGPTVEVGYRRERQVICNRIAGHDGPHQCRSRRNTRLIASWYGEYDWVGTHRVIGERK